MCRETPAPTRRSAGGIPAAAEAVDSHRAEEVSQTGSDVASCVIVARPERRHKRAPVCAAQNTTKYVHHGGEAVAFVAAALAVRAKRNQRAVLRHVLRIARRSPFTIHSPVRRDGSAGATGDFDLAICDDAGRHVDHHWRLFVSRKCDGHRVRPQSPLRAPPTTPSPT